MKPAPPVTKIVLRNKSIPFVHFHFNISRQDNACGCSSYRVLYNGRIKTTEIHKSQDGTSDLHRRIEEQGFLDTGYKGVFYLLVFSYWNDQIDQ